MRKLQYAYNCTNPGDSRELAAITDNFTDISYETFRRKVDTEQFDMLCSGLGYAVGNEKGLHIKNDWSVSFHKALYKGNPIYFFSWSSIEFVFKN